ncbi:MAG: carboxypeptidase-like regulatory domain-containing protein, partial [Bacteroidota bacterium]|nr:carboxypeptidase-like regulatory domain-containing protein [Bacteroidota bacterium]
MKAILVYIFFVITFCGSIPDVFAQNYSIKGTLKDEKCGEPLVHAHLKLKNTSFKTLTDSLGKFSFDKLSPGKYYLTTSFIGYHPYESEVFITDKDIMLQISLTFNVAELKEVIINSEQDVLTDISRLNAIEGTAIYSGKKSEVIVMSNVVGNLATNNSRQIYSKVPGLNIWESDGAGIQLGIGGRGLNPNRVSNFNTRQNGYDISADALGYPESYYAPSAEGVDRIEIVRGAASLQYGTQFGGFVNFRMKKGPEDKQLELVSRQTLGSFGLLNTFNSIGGTIKKVNYYSFYQHKRGNGWRPNSAFENNIAYGAVTYGLGERFSITAEYTFMNYIAQQPGGLTDALFKQNPRQSIRERNWFKVNWNLASLSADYKISENLKLNSMFFGLYANRSALGVLSFINRADHMEERDLWTDDFRNFGNETRLLYKYNLGENLSAFLVGFRYYNGFTDRRQGQGNDGREGKRSDFQFLEKNDAQFSSFVFPGSNKALFAENIFQLSPKLSITPGIRLENIQTAAKGTYSQINKDFAGNIILNETIEEERKSSRSFLLMGIGSSYQAKPDMEVYANLSQNYRSINFNDIRIINDNLRVDPNLRDERGMTMDIGFRGKSNNAIHY